MLRELGLAGALPAAHLRDGRPHRPDRLAARGRSRDALAEEMMQRPRAQLPRVRHPLFDPASGDQGIVHVIGPELGLTQPGMTIACGDSHTSTHGAFGAIAFGIGTTQVRDVLATQCLALARPKVRRIEVDRQARAGVYAKDVILAHHPPARREGRHRLRLRVRRRRSIERMSMEERMTVCNMSIEGGARVRLRQPRRDDLRLPARPRASRRRATACERAVALVARRSPSDADARYDDARRASTAPRSRRPSPGASTPARRSASTSRIPRPADVPDDERAGVAEALDVHGPRGRASRSRARAIDVAFIGSCTNGRLSDLREAARVARGRHGRAARARPRRARLAGGARARPRREGLDEVFRAAGFEWREAGCSMCLAMNPDKLVGDQLCASSSATATSRAARAARPGRTLLMSPAMVAAAAHRAARSPTCARCSGRWRRRAR